MGRPRIIIADTDINYINPLQFIFIEEFFDKIDLEIISDRMYFDEVFTSPQKVDILIISEELYNVSLQKQNISHIFLMTEQYEEEQTDELNINKIFKYTSIKEILNEIIGKASDSLKVTNVNKKEPQVVLVYSANGGAGKTTVALGISAALTKNYKRVLYVNAEKLHSFHYFLENKSSITSSEVYAKLTNPSANVYHEIKHVLRKELFTYLPPFKTSLMSLGIDFETYEKFITSAKNSKEYDFIIVDTDSTFDENKANLLNIADKVIMVTNQTISAIVATNLLISNINGVNSEKYMFVCNNFNKNDDNALISPNVSLKFILNEYIEHINHYDDNSCSDFSKIEGIQKTAFLVM